MSGQTEIVALSAVELVRLMRTRALSPVEVLEAFIARIEALDPAINAFTARCFERARAEARSAEALILTGEEAGPLHGLPFGVKDLQKTEGVLTTFGSPLFRDYVPDADSVMVARLRRDGAIMVGKTNTPEFGAGANTRNPVWGATGNPFDPMLTCGGSSGGSAAALAADLLPACTGSDTGGSLRIPAAFCGVVGFRPSPGMVPAEARDLGWTPISVLGPMARNIPDACLLFASQIGFDSEDPLSFPLDSAPFRSPEPVDLGALRVAYSIDLGTGIVSPAIKTAFERKLAAMRHLFKSCTALAMDFGEAERCFNVIRATSFVARYRDDYEKDKSLLGPNVRANYELGAAMSLADVAWAHVEQTRIFRRFQRCFADVDLILTPAVAVSPFPWQKLYLEEISGRILDTYYHWLAMSWFITLTTNPAVSLPCGTDDSGLPFGLQVVGPYRADRQLLNAGAAMEQVFSSIAELRRPLPDLARLAEPVPALRSIVTHPPGALATGAS
jgi:Asp-tRNA(Asn)/Glu-tRNA(Gln) amidotransferase A subunit family amidase